MSEMLYMILSFIAGLLLGVLFFGGLWFTVKKIVNTGMPAIWVIGSFIFRIGITLVGFYYVASGNWERLMICLVGFIVARFVVVHFTKPKTEEQVQFKKEDSHEA